MSLSCRSGCLYTQAVGATEVFIQRCAVLENDAELDAETMVRKALAILKHE